MSHSSIPNMARRWAGRSSAGASGSNIILERFYQELVRTQQILNQKHLGWAALKDTFVMAAKFLARGQTNFVKMLWKFSRVYNAQRQIADHRRETHYSISRGGPSSGTSRPALYSRKRHCRKECTQRLAAVPSPQARQRANPCRVFGLLGLAARQPSGRWPALTI
jgi:hypothetical protein